MKNLYKSLLIFICLAFFGQTAQAQCDDNTDGLAFIRLESPTVLSNILPLVPGENYTFVFFYNYILSTKGTDCIDPSTLAVVFDPPEAVNVLQGPTIAGSFVTIQFEAVQSTTLRFRITASACDPAKTFSCATKLFTSITVPVEFASFNTNFNEGLVDIDWQTASEINNEYFEVERSGNGFSFESIGTVEGAGNSSSLLSYTFQDDDPLVGANYYRVKQVDYDGQFDYSEVDVIRTEGIAGEFTFSPNPISPNQLGTFNFHSSEAQSATISVRGIDGRLISNVNYNANEGNNVFSLDERLETGIYVASLQLGNKNYNQKIIVQ